MNEICRKDQLARKSIHLSKSHPLDYHFIPKSWIFPADWASFKSKFKKMKRNLCFISKPDHGCQGKGIFLFKSLQTLENIDRNGMVVQEYIRNPCLLNGFKFDLRVYVLVTSISPLRIFVFNDGLARFATEPYEKPAKSNLKNMCMHLTNYAINKNSPKFIPGQDGSSGSKRTIQSVFEELETYAPLKTNASNLWRQIHDVIIKTLILVQPTIAKNCKSWFPLEASNLPLKGSQCFEILGFDIMLDSKLKPWVLEVNHSPSFSCDSPLDEAIKSRVILDGLGLLNVSKKSLKRDLKAKSIHRLQNSDDSLKQKMGNSRLDSEATLIESKSDLYLAQSGTDYTTVLDRYYEHYNVQVLEKLTKWEDRHCGNYTRVFPPENEEKLKYYLYLLQQTEKSPSDTLSLRLRKTFIEKKQKENMEKLKKFANPALRPKLKSTIPTNPDLKPDFKPSKSDRGFPRLSSPPLTKKVQPFPVKIHSFNFVHGHQL